MKNGTWVRREDGTRVGAVRLPDGTLEFLDDAKADKPAAPQKPPKKKEG